MRPSRLLLLVVAAAAISAGPLFPSAARISACDPSPGLWSQKSKLRMPHCGSWCKLKGEEEEDDDDDDASTARRRHCAADVLALVGSEAQRASLNSSRVAELRSWVRFLVPLRENVAQDGDWKKIREPPKSVADLARKAVEWAGEPDAVLAELSSAVREAPDVYGSQEARCVLTKHNLTRSFAKEEINGYMAFLFETISALAPSFGLNVSLNRYDLFHGHMFTAYDTGRLGILFHCKEYPQFDRTRFPLNLGYCQAGSTVPYDQSINLRNIVWLAPMPSCKSHVCSDEWLASGALFVLDASPDGVIFKELVSEWVDVVRTIYETDFGRNVIDVNYFRLSNTLPKDCIFLA